MKVLIDMNLSPTWVEALRAMGCEAAHFGAILAARPATSPSVIQVRAVDVTPGGLAPLVREALGRYADWLGKGALVTVEPSRLRARVLPLKRS